MAALDRPEIPARTRRKVASLDDPESNAMTRICRQLLIVALATAAIP